MEKTIYDLADEILNFLNTQSNRQHFDHLNRTFPENQTLLLAALHQLEDDRHIIKVQANYGITAKGQKFLRKGSYRVIHEKESKRDAYTDQLQESLLETNKATTNNFRVTERNFRITIRLTIIAIFVSGIVALSSVIDYFSLKQQSKQLQTQLQVLKQM